MSGAPADSPWLSERTDLATRLWRAGESAGAIAKALDCGLSRSAVVAKMHRLGLTRPPAVARIAIRLAASGRMRALRAGDRPPCLSDEKLGPPSVTETPHARPWMTRRFDECAFPVACAGADLHACCAPGRSRRPGGAAYCDAHYAAMFTSVDASEARTRPDRRGRGAPWDPDASVLPEWDAA